MKDINGLNPTKQVLFHYESADFDTLFSELHPAIHDLAVQLLKGKLASSN